MNKYPSADDRSRCCDNQHAEVPASGDAAAAEGCEMHPVARRAPATEDEIKSELAELGVDVLEPESKREESMARALEAFSSFVLEEGRERCRAILERHAGDSVGELQGGSDEHAIYRAVIADDEDGVTSELLREFGAYGNVLTVDKLRQYMLGMCDRRSRLRGGPKYRELGNVMFILAFGPTNGQVRHIDQMEPNIQICLYMSRNCASTIVYELDGPQITSTSDLVDDWTRTSPVPELIRSIMLENGETSLRSKRHTKYFAFWESLNAHLDCFGQLYRPVSRQLSLQTDPGTTFLAGGNGVHAGPPTVGPRMFAFAIGIPEEDESGDNDGELQYNPVTLHLDLCCILFSIMEIEHSERADEHLEAKRFLICILFTLAREYPKETYARLISDDRHEIREWLGNVVKSLGNTKELDALMQEAIDSESMFYSPDVGSSKKRRAKKKKGRRNAAK
uniref:Uncharacterized protein n=1 Tax=Odontella aurita TaxID=265563 RepID=A0A7S4J2Y2_9STRA|mmetsp:Transcript_37032/g.110907  ORF Transcript_37032/g.110907 Transcript_37032/m.110907 type:complete len:451 (+) Transcript_37032:168-1520(+)|eukprot:CAMPEP_0113545096 /NCGR_PEP_ID=MMETSP0015_2-20120614/11073_1 /TAXON_ID=2838 /ORGANISM="Odontella" /LENGTH=450 /DNA_ID=CAMNT_0000445427 /DNA_START=53 /DNA_END=1408 /DNA_ORIENTATION=- /assembly_acc=CAM_ASM_000160